MLPSLRLTAISKMGWPRIQRGGVGVGEESVAEAIGRGHRGREGEILARIRARREGLGTEITLDL